MTGIVGEVCSGAMLKRGFIRREVAVKVPANPDVTEFERHGEAATHELYAWL
jgi:hypothetical protein